MIVLVLIGAALLTLAACNATGHVDGAGDIPTPIGMVHVGVQATLNQPGHFDMNNGTNACFELNFYDVGGHRIGGATITPGPNSGTVPAGTSKWDTTAIPCPQMWAGQSVSGGRLRPFPGLRSYIVFGMPLNFDASDDTSNAVYSFVIAADNSGEAESVARAQIRAPIGTALDSRITVTTFFQTVVAQGSVSIVSLSREQPASFELDVNGQANYATLANGATRSQYPNGLWQVEAPVSWADVNGYGGENHVQVRTTTAGNPRVVSTDIRMTYLP